MAPLWPGARVRPTRCPQLCPALGAAGRAPVPPPLHPLQVLAGPAGAAQLGVLGELMMQSHASYSRCGLGAEGTDRLVQLVAEERAAAAAAGEQPAVHGAKITGGGSGGGCSWRELEEPRHERMCPLGNTT